MNNGSYCYFTGQRPILSRKRCMGRKFTFRIKKQTGGKTAGLPEKRGGDHKTTTIAVRAQNTAIRFGTPIDNIAQSGEKCNREIKNFEVKSEIGKGFCRKKVIFRRIRNESISRTWEALRIACQPDAINFFHSKSTRLNLASDLQRKANAIVKTIESFLASFTIYSV